MSSGKNNLKKAPFWLKLFAKVVDYSLVYVAEMLILAFMPFYVDDLVYYLLAVTTPIFWVPIEALLASTWGTTMGQSMCGIYSRCSKGKKVSFKEALKKALFLKKSNCYAFSKNLALRFTQILVIAGTMIACWGMVILGAPAVNQYVSVYKEWVGSTGWINYSASDKGFTVSMPGAPEKKIQVFDNPHGSKPLQYNEFKSCEGNNKVCYSVGYLDFPKSWRFAGAKKLLNGALQIMVTNEGANLVDSTMTKHERYPAIDFILNHGDDKSKGRIVLVGSTFYRLMATHPEHYAANPDQQKVDSFMNSFQLNG